MRTEHDSMGAVEVPDGAYWGASTQRAIDNFPVAGARFGRRFVWALGLIKGEAARVNGGLGILAPEIADAIARAADHVVDGRLDEHFVVGGGGFAPFSLTSLRACSSAE